MPDILLVTPINKTHYCVPPLGLGYLVSALRKAGSYSVFLLDPIKENVDYYKFAELLKEKKPKILGVQCFSFDVSSVNRMLEAAKGIDPSIITIVGGPHPTAVSESIFSDIGNLDFALKGEGEISFPLFTKAMLGAKGALDSIPGLIFKDKGRIMANPSEPIQDLDSLDMPAWDTIDPSTYPDIVEGGFYKDFPVAPILTSRGCPYDCTFCANKISMGQELRLRSIDKVVDEIEYLLNNHQVKEFHILDDNFTINKKRVLSFCQRIREKRIKTNFAFPNGVRLDSLDEEILASLREIGVYSITVAIESGSQKILEQMKKRLTLDTIKKKIGLIRKMKFIVNAFFIIGYPTENKEDILSTIKFARKLPLDLAQFSCFLPLPGTEITQTLLNSGKLKNINYADLFYSRVPFSPEGITKRELKVFQRRAFLSFYLRPYILFRLISRLKSFRHFNMILKRAKDYIFS